MLSSDIGTYPCGFYNCTSFPRSRYVVGIFIDKNINKRKVTFSTLNLPKAPR